MENSSPDTGSAISVNGINQQSKLVNLVRIIIALSLPFRRSTCPLFRSRLATLAPPVLSSSFPQSSRVDSPTKQSLAPSAAAAAVAPESQAG